MLGANLLCTRHLLQPYGGWPNKKEIFTRPSFEAETFEFTNHRVPTFAFTSDV